MTTLCAVRLNNSKLWRSFALEWSKQRVHWLAGVHHCKAFSGVSEPSFSVQILSRPDRIVIDYFNSYHNRLFHALMALCSHSNVTRYNCFVMHSSSDCRAPRSFVAASPLLYFAFVPSVEPDCSDASATLETKSNSSQMMVTSRKYMIYFK